MLFLWYLRCECSGELTRVPVFPLFFQINIGTIGHVAHGKSTVVKAISGVQTVRFKNELERNITIKLGYANAKVCVLSSRSIKAFYLLNLGRCLRSLLCRSLNVTTKLVLDRETTSRMVRQLPPTPLVNDQDVAVP
jgi:hypothetical protein